MERQRGQKQAVTEAVISGVTLDILFGEIHREEENTDLFLSPFGGLPLVSFISTNTPPKTKEKNTSGPAECNVFQCQMENEVEDILI